MTSLPEAGISRARPRVLAVPGMVVGSLAVFFVLLLSLHVLRTDLNSASRFVSEYAVGDYGAIMVLALLAMEVASLALVAALRSSVPNEARSTTGMVLIGVWGAGMLPLALFPIGVGDTVGSTADIIHRTTALVVFLAVSIGVLLVSRGFRRQGAWQQLATPGIVLSIVLLIGYLATFGGYALNSGFEGLSQRIFLLVLAGWMGLVLWRGPVSSSSAT
jgi:hypothetical protein